MFILSFGDSPEHAQDRSPRLKPSTFAGDEPIIRFFIGVSIKLIARKDSNTTSNDVSLNPLELFVFFFFVGIEGRLQ